MDAHNTERVTQYLEMAGRELDRVAHISRQTLGFYRDTSSASRLSVTHILDDLLSLYERRFESRKINMVKEYDGDIEITALGGELRQAFSNLIGNAVDAMPAGGTLVIRATQTHSRNGAHRPGVRITILDTGEGIAPQHRKNLFQPFFTTKEDVGTGLGLWITRSIVEKHGGTIRLKSRTGPDSHGTAFSIFLPVDGKASNAKPTSLAGMGRVN